MQPDGRVAVFYSKHTGSSLLMRVSTCPEDVSSFGPERVVARTGSSAGMTYGNPVYVPAEHRTYVFFRGGSSRPTVTWSDDGLRTWSPARALVVPTGRYTSARPYVKYATNGWDTVLLAFTDGHPRDEPHDSVYAMTLRGGIFRTVAGAPIATLEPNRRKLPVMPVHLSSVQRLYDGSQPTGKAWVWSTGFDTLGLPVVAFATFPKPGDHRYWYASWDGAGWAVRQFARAGGSIAGSGDEPDYSGGIELDHSDPSYVYTSRRLHGQWEIERWHTPDRGGNWDVPVQLTRNSPVKQIRPVVPWGPAGEVKVLWMSGRYDSWNGGYRTALRELTTGPAPTTLRLTGPTYAVRQSGVTLTGRLVRGSGGTPLPGGHVTLYALGLPVARGVTASDGTVRLTVVHRLATTYELRYDGDAGWGSSAARWTVG